MKILVKCLAVLYLGILNESSRMNGYVIIMLVFRYCPHRSSVSRVIRKLKLLLLFSVKKWLLCRITCQITFKTETSLT